MFHPKFKGLKLLVLFLLLLPTVGLLLAFGVTHVLLATRGEDPPGQSDVSLSHKEESEFLTKVPEKTSYRLLLCGIDHTRTLADVILYARLDLEENRLWLLQIPRDLYVEPNSATGKINGVCRAFSSADPTVRIAGVLKEQLGLPVDGSAAITLAGVRALVDAVGGVPLTLEQRIDYLPGEMLPAGEQVITGEQAEWLLRYRNGYRMGDLDRLKVQKQFLLAALGKTHQIGRAQALSIAAKNMGHIKTTIPFSEIAPLLERAVSLTVDQVDIGQIPTYGTEYRGLSVLCVNRFRLAEMLNAGVCADDPVDPWKLQLVYPPEPVELPNSSEEGAEWENQPILDFSWGFSDEGETPVIE